MSISFIQFTLCDLCRVSHNVGKKHVYSKRHQEIVKNVLAKYLRKIVEAKQYLKAPEVHDLLWEDGAKVWCYFCSTEVPKHERKVDAALSFRCHTFLLHLATPEHEAACKSFFWKNKINKSTIGRYLLDVSDITRCESLLKVAEEKYLEKMEKLHQKMVADMRRTDEWRAASQANLRLQQLPTSFGPSLPSEPGCSSWSAESHNSLHKEQMQPTPKGNIFSGARPPWLDDDDDDDEPASGAPLAKRTCVGQISQKPIGPSLEDFKQHREAEKRKKLNPRRVGANFDHFSETSDEWLPSFGRVWNFGRRWQSRHQFRREENKPK
ncbi:centrosomal AT-AC splicing factor isoform X1 [Ixodes scapularis]|uniref:centrosomal AT-AC splicing factor isoform X1 n=2 Tax=Ixodes scapularis TaxID=6945 RepID=UPI001A9E90D9|nr:centrosomal AT-AC splicing factor isoform X1 [Ixodes scapularis]